MIGTGACQNSGPSKTEKEPTGPALDVEAHSLPSGGSGLDIEAMASLERRLRAYVKTGAKEDGFPWALAHGILAFGPAHRTDKNRLAINAIAHHLESRDEGLGFPKTTADGLVVEAHPNSNALALFESGLAPTRRLSRDNQSEVALREIMDDALSGPWRPTDDDDWARGAWSLSLFFHQRSGQDADQLADRLLSQLEAENAFLEPLFERRRPDLVQKRKQGIYRHSCGGFHFVQAALLAASQRSHLQARARHQLELLTFRWEAERSIYAKVAERHPQHGLLIAAQRLRFFGHLIETWALAAQWGLVPISEASRLQFRSFAADLNDAVSDLAPLYADLGRVRKVKPQAYNDLIGDACHAIRGLSVGRKILFPKEDPNTNPEIKNPHVKDQNHGGGGSN